jgi:hypothetical protein
MTDEARVAQPPSAVSWFFKNHFFERSIGVPTESWHSDSHLCCFSIGLGLSFDGSYGTN